MGIRKSGDANLWPFGVIPFEINAKNFPEGSPERAEILAGIEILNTRTNLTLVHRSAEEDYVEFVQSEERDACRSRVGRGRGRQEVKCATDLDDFGPGTVVHEILHAAGFYHEHQREDRDKFIKVDFDNIIDGKRFAFEKKGDADDVGQYDLVSRMHYFRRAFAKDSSKDVITPIDGGGNPTADQVGGRQLSAADVEFISRVYPFKAVPDWFGAQSRGADIAVGAVKSLADRTDKTSTDLVVAWVTAGREKDRLYYRVGWEMDGAARPQQGWSDPIDVPELTPDSNLEVEGIGVALGDINASGSPDLIIAYIGLEEVHPRGARKAFYRIGWDLDSNTGEPTGLPMPAGPPKKWSDPFEIPGDIPTPYVDPPVDIDPDAGRVWGNVLPGLGAVGLALDDIDGDGQPDEMVFFYVLPVRDSDLGFYRVGFDLDAAGAANRWSDEFAIPVGLDARTNGAAVTVADVGDTKRKNLLMYQVANPNGPNRAFYWIGPDMEPTGKPVSEADPTGAIVEAPWSPRIPLPGLLGPRSQGGGLAVVQLAGQHRLLYFFLDNPSPGQNRGVYRAVPWNPAKPWTTGTIGTTDPPDIIEYVIEPGAADAPGLVEFKLELGPNIKWPKRIGVPTIRRGENYTWWIEAHDDVRSKSSFSLLAVGLLGRGFSLQFEKAMVLGVITGVGSKPLSDFPSLEAGSRITFTWVEDGGWRP
jgi:hypothetical protein